MRPLTGRVTIDAPIERVFLFMNRPENQARITPALSHVEALEVLDNGGKRASYVYSMGPVELTGEVRAIEFEPNERIVFEMTGDLSGTIEWMFEPAGQTTVDDEATANGKDADRTTVTYSAEYDLPTVLSLPVVSDIVDQAATPYNRRQLEATLSNLRQQVEADEENR
ncbi:SRPBCC family protein [Halalkalirubrum salinum]|uniref:SRPBCC family protein n=1 Tax=Halalkalirubrum salinum TaxID=2563889 RepID=UPI0010FB6FB9|nr:SRPBCC family protein [Halalkalirubrum salinum]